MNKKNITLATLVVIVITAFYLSSIYLQNFYIPNPWTKRYITVTGISNVQQANEIAMFSAGVSTINDDKQAAINEVNTKMAQIIESVKALGVDAKDIKTQNISFYLEEEYYYDDAAGTQRSKPGRWRANNNIDVKLINITKMDALTNIFTQSGATNVYGPSFSVDASDQSEAELINAAIQNAHQKAQTYAAANGLRVGAVLSVIEGNTDNYGIYNRYAYEGMGGGGYVEPGASTLYKTVTVTFQLK